MLQPFRPHLNNIRNVDLVPVEHRDHRSLANGSLAAKGVASLETTVTWDPGRMAYAWECDLTSIVPGIVRPKGHVEER